jgi:acetyl-CoA carboxylase / biotin carboxylase 1
VLFRGHASEKPELPRMLHDLDIVFLGPRESAMAALGDKIGSTILAQTAGVPTLPWSGSGVTTQAAGTGDVAIPEAVYLSACVHSVEAAVESCQKIGYPAMLKVCAVGFIVSYTKRHNTR